MTTLLLSTAVTAVRVTHILLMFCYIVNKQTRKLSFFCFCYFFKKKQLPPQCASERTFCIELRQYSHTVSSHLYLKYWSVLVLFGSKNSLVAFGAAADYLVPFNKHVICSFRWILLQTHLPKSQMGCVFAGMYMIFIVYQSPYCLIYYHHKVPGMGGQITMPTSVQLEKNRNTTMIIGV